MPPSTPLPVKSRGSNGFWSRSTGGMSFGMSVGATTVWNPFGGGLAATMTSGGGCSGGGLGGSGGFRKTIVVSTGRFLMVSATPWVAFTAPKMMSAVQQDGQNRLSHGLRTSSASIRSGSRTRYYLQGEG